MIINLNDIVEVYLTSDGLKALKDDYEKTLGPRMSAKHPWVPPVIDAQGKTRMHLHEVMNKLGPYMYMGSTIQPIVGNQIIL